MRRSSTIHDYSWRGVLSIKTISPHRNSGLVIIMALSKISPPTPHLISSFFFFYFSALSICNLPQNSMEFLSEHPRTSNGVHGRSRMFTDIHMCPWGYSSTFIMISIDVRICSWPLIAVHGHRWISMGI